MSCVTGKHIRSSNWQDFKIQSYTWHIWTSQSRCSRLFENNKSWNWSLQEVAALQEPGWLTPGPKSSSSFRRTLRATAKLHWSMSSIVWGKQIWNRHSHGHHSHWIWIHLKQTTRSTPYIYPSFHQQGVGPKFWPHYHQRIESSVEESHSYINLHLGLPINLHLGCPILLLEGHYASVFLS